MSPSPDSHYSISTPENVDLHLELAGVGSRIWAAFVDMLIIYAVLLLIFLLALGAVQLLGILGIPEATKTIVYYYIIGFAILLAFFIQFGYFILFEKQWKGQTPGKKLAQIRVIEANGQPVNWSSVVIRNLVRIVDSGLMMIGVVVMIFDPNERRLGDMLGGTLVIRERLPELSIRNLKITAEAPATSFVDAGQLSPDEYHLLQKFLRRRHQMETSHRARLARQLEEYFRLKLNPENQGETPEIFLEKVYLSYSERAQLEAS